MAPCLSENDVMEYYARRLSTDAAERIEIHVEACRACRELLDASASTAVEGGPETRPERPRAARTPDPVGGGFRAGDLLAERYRVIRLLGSGGMGEVYEVDDLELGERVALKKLRLALADDLAALERFRREAQLARKVTHPNVCRIFDVGRHVAKDGTSTLFMTMALLAGESLGARLRRDGPLSPTEARRLVEEMAAGLDAAHAEGVIHRDFKSDNVQLVPRGGGVTAMVTDFGLARSDAPGVQPLTGTGAFVGTPEYMAPEQVENAALSPATDVYALGVVMFEMVTGRLPFSGDSPLAVAAKRLKQAAPSPRAHSPKLDRAWEAAILRCLERDPARRFPTAKAAAAALGRSPRLRLVRWPIAAALALAAVVAGAWAWRAHRSAPVAHERPPARRALVIASAKSVAPEQRWLEAALDDLVAASLTAPEWSTVSSRRAAEVRRDLALPDGPLDAPARARLASAVAADRVLAIGYSVGGDQLIMTVDGAEVARGPLADPAGAVAGGADELRRRVGLPPIAQDERARLLTRLPSGAAAAAFASAIERIDGGDARGARELLVRAVAADPAHPRPHAALAAVLAQLGYEGDARSEVRSALAGKPPLGAEERVAVEILDARLARDFPRAEELARAEIGRRPGDPEAWLRLVAIELEAHRGADALAALADARPCLGPDARADLQEAQARGLIDDAAGERAAIDRAIAVAARGGQRHALAEAQLRRARTLVTDGRAADAVALADRAAQDLAALADEPQAARALKLAAQALAGSDPAQSRRRLADALERMRALDHQDGVAELLVERATLERRFGDLSSARRTIEQAIELQRRLGWQGRTSALFENLGEIMLAEGDLAGARGELELALEHRRVGQRRNEAVSLERLAEDLYQLGDARARVRLEESLTLWESERDGAERGRAHVLEGRLALDEGRAAAAEAAFSRAGDELRSANRRDPSLGADAWRALALAAEARTSEARALVERLEEPSGTAIEERLDAAIALGLARAVCGAKTPATALLESAREQAARLGYGGRRLEAEWALVRVASGERKRGTHDRALRLATEAHARGFLRLERAASGVEAARP